MVDKIQNKIMNLPMTLIASYLLFSIFLFVISPMFASADNRILAISYGIVAIAILTGGYRFCVKRDRYVPHVFVGGTSIRLNIAITLMTLWDIVYFGPQIQMALAYYGFDALDVFSDVGGNYLKKDALIEEIGQASLGPLYAIINLLAFCQIMSFILPTFKWREINWITRSSYIVAVAVTMYFYVATGTMAGAFYVFILSASGWIAGRYAGSLVGTDRIISAAKDLKKMAIYAASFACIFFVFMVYNLSSRATRLNLDLPLLYSDDSILYRLFGHEIADGIGLSLAYISHGWYGLGKSFEVDFLWTHGLASSRVITSYYYRFAGIVSEPIPLSYPVRQENFTGYPPFSYWSTIFPWLASDVTFAGALVLTGMFGYFYAKVWLGAIREGCLVSVSLFGLLTIGALFINANSQILDNKLLAIAFFALVIMYPFRRQINALLLR